MIDFLLILVLSSIIQTRTTLSSSIITIISPSSLSTVRITTTSSIYFNTTTAPYACDDISLACLAYSAYCAREIEFSGIPCRVLCPRTCNTCKLKILHYIIDSIFILFLSGCEDFYTDGTCSLVNCQRNPQLQQYCRNSCICQA